MRNLKLRNKGSNNIILYFTTILSVLIMSSAITRPALADVGRIELYTIQSMTLTDREFLTGKKDGSPVTISGELRYPHKKLNRYPVVILVHGSGGITGSIDDWAQNFNKLGVAVFIIDSFTGRGLYKVNNDQSQLGRLAMIVDAYRSLDLLAQHKRIDPERIAIMGFSRGGQVALYSSMKRFHRLHGSALGHEFAAYIALYPSCNTQYKDDQNIVNKPVRIFHGSADNYSYITPCRNYVEQLQKNAKDIVLHEYPNAHHVFDSKQLVKPVVLTRAQTTRSCTLKEVNDGLIINTQNGKPFTYDDPCVESGPTVAFNSVAYSKAKATLNDFVTSIFDLR